LAIRNGTNPILSGDGNRLFFERHAVDGIEIWYFDVATKKQRKIASRRGQGRLYDANADGSRILFAAFSSTGGMGDLATPLLVDVANGATTKIPDCSEAVFSSAGLVFLRVGKRGLWLRRENGEVEPLRPNGDYPSVSPNGRLLLYATNVGESPADLQWEVWDSKEDLVTAIGVANSPVFSADGNVVIYSELGIGSTWAIDTKTGQRKVLGQRPGPVGGWRTSRGGPVAFAGKSLIVFDTKRGTLRQLPIGQSTITGN